MKVDNPRLQDFKKVKQIGEGTYGVVYKATDLKSPDFVAIKVVKFENSDEGVPATALREISILKSLDHPNIVKLKEVIYSSDGLQESLSLVFEYLDLDLQQALLDEKRALGKAASELTGPDSGPEAKTMTNEPHDPITMGSGAPGGDVPNDLGDVTVEAGLR